MGDQSRASLVEDALARVLSRAYIAAASQDDEYEEGPENFNQVADDERTLREFIFATLSDRSTK